jgi:drug/metabolite transporter (DMT)-like permease
VGDALVFVNAASWGIYLVLVRPMIKKYPTTVVMQWIFIYGTLVVFPFGFSQVMEVQWQVMPAGVIWAVVYVVVATTFLAYLLNNYALKSISPSGVSIYIYLQPLLASLFAIAWGSDHWSMDKWISLGLVFAGIYLVTFRTQKL